MCIWDQILHHVNKVNGQINAIHDDSLELTEFKGHFSPFDLDNLELKCMQAEQSETNTKKMYLNPKIFSKDMIQIQI